MHVELFSNLSGGNKVVVIALTAQTAETHQMIQCIVNRNPQIQYIGFIYLFIIPPKCQEQTI